jgi:hypothetical protein
LNNTGIGAIAGIALVLVLAFVFAIFPADSEDTIFFIQKDGSTPEPCTGNVGLVLAQNITDLCDVDAPNPTDNQFLRHNGTQWVNESVSFGIGNVTSVTSDSNSTIGVVPTDGDVVLYPSWEKLCSNTSSGGASLACNSFEAKKYLMVKVIPLSNSGGTEIVIGLQFNNDNGTNYAWRRSINTGADTTGTNTNQCQPRGASTFAGNGGGIITFNVENISTIRKMITGTATYGSESDDTVAPSTVPFSCKWDNASSQITSIKLMKVSGVNNYASGTDISVWGHD